MKKAILIAGLLFFYPHLAAADEKPSTYHGKIRIVTEVDDLYQFSDLPATVPATVTIAKDIDFKSYKGSWNFRTTLRDGLKDGANSAGKYAVITNGCGSPCQVNWIVNVETGKVLGSIGTAMGLQYRKDSELLIADMPEDPMNITKDSLWVYPLHLEFYRILDDKLIALGRVKMFDRDSGYEAAPYDKK